LTLTTIFFIRTDLLINVAWIISLDSSSSLWFKAIGLLRIITLIGLLSEVEETTEIREIMGNYFELLKLGGIIFLCAHLSGCCWYAIAKYQEDMGINSTWFDKDTLSYDTTTDLNPVFRGYVAAFYWAIITMCTVGYGDISPTTYRERIFVIFMCLLASFLFAFSMNSIGKIIS
jgi:hypothetical protein